MSIRLRVTSRMAWCAMLLALAGTFTVSGTCRGETPEEWIALGARVHGGFGSFIPVGIRIGLDALARLGAKPRDVSVLYYDGEKAPCACFADGVMIATVASPGQRTLQIAAEKAPSGVLAVIIVRDKRSNHAVKYTVSDAWLAKLAEWNRALDPRGRYDAVMTAEGLYAVEPAQ
jgi:formylmethanofuran dehydrogenase subunit E